MAVLTGADWLQVGADAQHSNWQRFGNRISTRNTGELKLLWKRRLENRSRGANSLTAPVILGPIITHRGVKELVFVGGASDNLFAVDADLGKVFWTRHIDVPDDAPAQPPCGAGLTAAPLIAPPPPGAKIPEESDEGNSPMRPFYFVASDGVLHTIRPSDSLDMAPPRPFVPAHAWVTALSWSDGWISAATVHGCAGVRDGVWKINAADPRGEGKYAGPEGAPSDSNWVDRDGTRWRYRAGKEGLRAFHGIAEAWRAAQMAGALPPLIMNGVLYVLAPGKGSTHAVFYALDARTGKQLYSSGEQVASFVDSSGLAVANGHIFFGTADNTLYCFGLPLEIE